MVLQCCVKGCETVGNNTFHSFPRNKLTAEKWISAAKAFHLVERLNTNELANSYYKVCRKHFDGSDLTKNGKGQIVVKPNCVPRLFLPNETVVPPASAIADDSQHQRSLATNKLTIQLEQDEQADNADKADVVKLISGKHPVNRQKSARQTANCSKVANVTVNEIDSDVDVVDGISGKHPVNQQKSARQTANCSKIANVTVNEIDSDVDVVDWISGKHPVNQQKSARQTANCSKIANVTVHEIDSDVDVVDGISGKHPVNQQKSERQTANCSKVTQVTVNEIEVIPVKHPVNQQKSARKTANRSKSSPKASITMNAPRSSKLSYYKRRAKELQQKVKENKLNDATVLNYLKTKFNEQLLEFVDMQLKNCGRSKHGRRYTPKQKSLCLAMYKQGPKAYRFNEKWACLPTRRTLGRYSAQLIFKSGIDEKILAAVKNIVTNWSASDKYCTFGWDEVSLNEHLDYCQSMDKIEGFVEMCKPKVPIFATHALTFMVRGIAVPYKQSVGYFYTNGVKSFELVELVKSMIERVSTTGLKPILSVCDTCSVNASTVNELVYPRANQTQQTGQLLQYKVNGHRIIHTYDPSHLIKVIRNNFEVKNVAHFISERWQPGREDYDGPIQIATWDDINQLYRMDIRAVRSVLPKLTDEHLKPNKLKMKVSVATQVFSNTCGSVMLECVDNGKVPEDFTTTARFILFVNDLFDSINGCDKYPVDSLKSAVTPKSIHSEFWEYALVMLENMFFVDKGTGERNNRSSVLKKFESTIRGYQDVARTCFQAGIPKLEIRNTTQDGLENFFGCVKSCNSSNKTTANQYRTGYTTMIINNISGTNSLKTNCQPDDSTAILTNIHEFISVCREQPSDAIYLSYPEPVLSGCHDSMASTYDDDVDYVDVDDVDVDSLIYFDPEGETEFGSSNVMNEADDSLNSQFLDTNVDLDQLTRVSNDGSRVCQKVLRTLTCNDCKENVDLMDQDAALMSVEKLLEHLSKTIVNICSQDSIKKKLLSSVEGVDVHVIGCSDHADVIVRKVKNVAVDQVLLSFCNNINQILSGKIDTLPAMPNAIQKIAFEHRIKKRGIGKYTDKFIS